MRVLGIEGTAWNLSAAIVDEKDVICESSSAYLPPSGGIHPRDAAQHHASRMKEVIGEVLSGEIDGVAFSQGPGMGPCLRTVATAARALSLSLDVPLIGVNHCIAHIEVGRWRTPAEDPVVLYVSGANSQVLSFVSGSYRILGETLDISIGNALDKFARFLGLQHPGGPKVEALAKEAEKYLRLPYIVKGMDLSFSGLSTAAQELVRKGESENDVAFSLQETAFSMLVEVTERALAHCRKDEVLLVGGVAMNERLKEMLSLMCEERGARFYSPEQRFLGDNGAMIAYTGLLFLKNGIFTSLENSKILPNFRPESVEIPWIKEKEKIKKEIVRGAEAVIKREGEEIVKTRVEKGYRVEALDENIRRERTKNEAKIIHQARRAGVPTPIINEISLENNEIRMEFIDGKLLRNHISEELSCKVGELVGILHSNDIIHGDLTTSNLILSDGKIYLIDFGLSFFDQGIEAKGVDVHVFFQTLRSTYDGAESLIKAFVDGYRKSFSKWEEVLKRVEEIERRGRYL